MPQGSRYDESGKLLWKFCICTEFDCNPEYAAQWKVNCGGVFWTDGPCLFKGEHEELNLKPPNEENEVNGHEEK